jgi:D-glycero-alpha-D-manno-heptose-7-phosphate kinase
MEQIEKLLIPDTADLADAMAAIRSNARGIILVHDIKHRVVGMLTDGDISKALLKHEDLHAPVTENMNRDFVWVPKGTPKETTLRLLDARIRAIPVLDNAGQLITLVSTGYLEARPETYARAKAPIRISLAGGGTDFTNYFTEHGGVSLSATIAKHSHAILRKRQDREIVIYSHDLNKTSTHADIHHLEYDGTLDLIKAGINVMKPQFGFELSLSSDFLPGSGLGGSATALSAIIGCLNECRDDRLDNYLIAEHAFEAERIELGISGGWQDQYSTVFGGFNFIEFGKSQNTVTPLRINRETLCELEERFLMCYTGTPHLGEEIQAKNCGHEPNTPEILKFAEEIKSIAYLMKSHLVRGSLADFGAMLNETWQLKKQFNSQVTNDNIDAIYDAAIKSGAEGGRLLGTGGGGYFLFFVKPFERFRVAQAMEKMGLATESVVFDDKGLQSWTAR